MADDYQILFQKADTIASGSTLNPGDTQFKLTSGNFGTHIDYYVVDYDIPALAEVVELSVNGTTATVISRGRDKTSQQPHTQGAKVGSMWTTSHQIRIQSALNALTPITLQSYAISDLVMPTPDATFRTVPGCTVSIPVPNTGTILVTAMADCEVFPTANKSVILVGQVLVDGTSLRGQLIFGGSSPASQQLTTRATLSKSWTIPVSYSGQPTKSVTFQMERIGDTGSALVHQDHSSVIVTYNQTISL